MPVPLLELTAQNLALEQEFKGVFDRVFRSGQYINGPDVAEFELEVAQYTGARHAIGVSSGTDAILLALMALEIGLGDEVLCPSFTFFATGGCIARLGAKPVFVDSAQDTFNLNTEDARRKVTPRTKAIIPVHLFGQCADMDGVNAVAAEHGLHVIEDAAQSLGATFKGKSAGTMGTFGTYSFFPSKNLGGFGDAGMLVCNDDGLAEKARLLRNHGAQPKYYHKYIGGNFRIDTLQAALLRIKLPLLDGYNAARKRNAAQYRERLGSARGLTLPAVAAGCEPIWNQFTIRVSGGRRDELRAKLQGAGIGTEVYYPVPLHEQECFAEFRNSCPVAAELAREVLSLPVFPELNAKQINEVAESIERAMSA